MSSLLRSNVTVAAGTAVSRITGLARVAVLGIVLSQGPVTDAYDQANGTPNMIYELLLGGVLSATLVPLFTRLHDDDDDEATSAVISVGIVDAGDFKGAFAAEALRERQEAMLQKYVELARSLGIPATYRYDIGTEIVDEATNLCVKIAQEVPRITFFSGKVIFTNEGWFDRVLHNQTAFAIQRRLHWADRIMVVMPVRIR